MTRRTYDPELQAALSERIRSSPHEEWEEFLHLWMAFNAIYNAVEYEGSEREQVRRSGEVLEVDTAKELLDHLQDVISELAENPPGDMLYASTSPNFYDAVGDDVEKLREGDDSPRQEMSALLALVYQVRCNLIHGNKDPARERDLRLVQISNSVLQAVLPELEMAISSS